MASFIMGVKRNRKLTRKDLEHYASYFDGKERDAYSPAVKDVYAALGSFCKELAVSYDWDEDKE